MQPLNNHPKPINNPPKPLNRPKLTNRGAAGLLTKVTTTPTEMVGVPSIPKAEVNNINPGLQEIVRVKIADLQLDPNNARLHPERNMQAIKDSLQLYGQVKPIVVRSDTMTVMAGNGTMEAAKDLGWTEIAVVMIDMTDVTAAGYGLADNRTAELARWDFEVVARLDQLIQAENHPTVGWSVDELAVMRGSDWDELIDVVRSKGWSDDCKRPAATLDIFKDELPVIEEAVERIKAEMDPTIEFTMAEYISMICRAWLDTQPPF